MYIASLRLIFISHIQVGNYQDAQIISAIMFNFMNTKTSLRVQLFILIDQLYIHYQIGEWSNNELLKNEILKIQQFARLITDNKYGSLTSEEICYMYGK